MSKREDLVVSATTDIENAIEKLKKQYEVKPENPISSVLIQLELVKMNLTKHTNE